MATTTISRTSFTDDTGDGLSGDVWDAALIGTSIYDPIDSILSSNLELGANLYIPSGDVRIGTATSNGNNANGLTIQQGTADDEVLSFKSTDVNASTVISESQTYAGFKKTTATGGGLTLFSASDGNAGTSGCMRMEAYQRLAASTTHNNTASAIVEFYATNHDGAGTQSNPAADSNIFAIQSRVSGASRTLFLVDVEGNMWTDDTITTFDSHDDIALCEALDRLKPNGGAGLREWGWGDWTRYNESALIDANILGAPIAEGGLTNQSALSKLHNGAIRQLGRIVRALCEHQGLDPATL